MIHYLQSYQGKGGVLHLLCFQVQSCWGSKKLYHGLKISFANFKSSFATNVSTIRRREKPNNWLFLFEYISHSFFFFQQIRVSIGHWTKPFLKERVKLNFQIVDFPLGNLMVKRERKMWNICSTGTCKIPLLIWIFFLSFLASFLLHILLSIFIFWVGAINHPFLCMSLIFKTVQWQCLISLWWQIGQESRSHFPWWFNS